MSEENIKASLEKFISPRRINLKRNQKFISRTHSYKIISDKTLSSQKDENSSTKNELFISQRCTIKIRKRKRNSSRIRSYFNYLTFIWVRMVQLSLVIKLLYRLASTTKFAGWAQISKRQVLLRIPSICKKSFDYYSARIVISPTATFFLKIKKFRPASYYWHRAGEKSQSTSSTENAFNGQSKTSTSSDGVNPSSSRLRKLPFYTYFQSLKWFPIPLSLGFALLAYQHYRRVFRRARKGQKTTNEEYVHQDWEITCYRKIPWKTVSRAWGWINSITLPEWTRSYVLGWYASVYHCDLNEAETDDLRCYKNLGEFFRRNLKTGLRPIDPHSAVVSPCDGKVFHMGRVDCDGVIEQVKGVRYSLQTFLGPATWTQSQSTGNSESEPLCDKPSNGEYCSRILKKDKNTSLFYCVIYLAPGDYHRFHSPADWQVNFRRHFAGELLSVNPAVANWIGGLFSLNERAVYIGNWKHGFFSMTAVGATNVGSIKMYHDQGLQTNVKGLKKNMYHDNSFEQSITFNKGDSFGEFNFGSTIVIIFEAPNEFRFTFENNGCVKVGQGMFHRVQQIKP